MDQQIRSFSIAKDEVKNRLAGPGSPLLPEPEKWYTFTGIGRKIAKNLIKIVGLSLFILIFIIDLQTPLGIADGILYIGVLFLFIWAADRKFISIVAFIAIVLIIAGYFLSPPAVANQTAIVAIVNRIFSIIVVFACTIVISMYKKSESTLQDTLKKMSDYKYALDESAIIAITDQKGVITKVNSNFCKISKYNENELIGKDHRIINSGHHTKEFMQKLWRTISNGKIWQGEIKNKAKDGTYYWVETTIVPFLNDLGKPYQYLSIRADITDRKKVEEGLLETSYQLNAANKELVLQNEEKIKIAAELTNANKNLQTFTFISSHDLQEPLRKIQLLGSMILEDEDKDLSERTKKNFKQMQCEAARMRQLILDLVAFSHFPTAVLKFEKTSLIKIIEEVKTELKDTIEEKKATIDYQDNCSANIIPSQFHQLMYNLISNSLKFQQPGIFPLITVKSRIVKGGELKEQKFPSKNNYCHISITDNGIGFEPRYKDRIFEVFQRLHGREVYAGTGIGLAIVKKIVENHKGIITVTSELKKGTTFNIFISEN